MAEARIEEAGVVHPELAHRGVVGEHLGGVVGGHPHRLLGREDVELARVEDQRGGRAGPHLVPEVVRLVVAQPAQVDQAGMPARPIAETASPAPARSTVTGTPFLISSRSRPVDQADRARSGGASRRRWTSGVPRLIRIWFSRSPRRTRTLKVRGAISA